MGEIRGRGRRRRRRSSNSSREIGGREESCGSSSSFSRGVQIQHVEEESSSKSFKEKCSHLAKKQRAKFYILRRCITMLVCWHERNDPLD